MIDIDVIDAKARRHADKKRKQDTPTRPDWADVYRAEFIRLIVERCAQEADSVKSDFYKRANSAFCTEAGRSAHNSAGVGASSAASAIRALLKEE